MTMEDINIKQSCEYRWRMHFFKMAWIMFAIVFAVSFLVSVFSVLQKDVKFAGEVIALVVGITTGTMLVCYLPFALYCFFKAQYLVKNYKNFSLHQVELNQIFTSYWYRYSNAYSVTITVDGAQKTLNTSPMFSGVRLANMPVMLLNSPIRLEEYNNQNVWVLYDQTKDKIYVVGK